MKMVAVIRLAVLLLSVGIVQAAIVSRNSIVLMDIGLGVEQNEGPRTIADSHPQEGTGTLVFEDTHAADQNRYPVGEEENTNDVDVVINLDSYVNEVGPMFVGVTFDSSIFRRKWNSFNTTSKQLQSLAKGLAPSLIRVGGTAADFLIFKPQEDNDTSEETFDDVLDYDYEEIEDDLDYHYYDGDHDDEVDIPIQAMIKNYTVTAGEWKKLNDFVHEVGWNLIFDFNQFLRKGTQWDPENARQLLTFSQGQNFSIPHFQLGNEPNSYHFNFNFSIPASRLVKDMQQLRSLLAEFPAYQNSHIIGPDVTKVTERSAKNYLQEFVSTGGQNIVAAVTLHHYYFNAREHRASVRDFVNTTILNYLLPELTIARETAHALAPQLPLWFSETSSVSGGGLPGVSDGYAAGFMWLDKLGLSALAGFKAVLRQSFINGNYALISNDFDPYPDYFLTLLYKRLVQGPVFNVTSSTDTVRMYAACANPSSYQKGALTVYILNVRDQSTALTFTQFAGHQYELYLLTPGDEGGLQSPSVALNGQKLVMVDEELPPLHPLITTGRITFPAYSFGYVVIPQADVQFCS